MKKNQMKKKIKKKLTSRRLIDILIFISGGGYTTEYNILVQFVGLFI